VHLNAGYHILTSARRDEPPVVGTEFAGLHRRSDLLLATGVSIGF